MAQRCDFRREVGEPRCDRPSQGSMGMMRFCRRCFAHIVGWPEDDPRVKQITPVQLMSGSEKLSIAQWVPDVAISRARQKAHAR